MDKAHWFNRLTEYSKSRLTTGSLIIGFLIGYGFESYFSSLISSLDSSNDAWANNPELSYWLPWQVWASIIFFAHFLRFSVGNFLHLIDDYWRDRRSIAYFIDLVVVGVHQALFIVAGAALFKEWLFPTFARLLAYILVIDVLWLLCVEFIGWLSKKFEYESPWPAIPQRWPWIIMNALLLVVLYLGGAAVSKQWMSPGVAIDAVNPLLKVGFPAALAAAVSVFVLIFDLKGSPAFANPGARARDEKYIALLYESVCNYCESDDFKRASHKIPLAAYFFIPAMYKRAEVEDIKFSRMQNGEETTAESRCLAAIEDHMKGLKPWQKKLLKRQSVIYCMAPPTERDMANDVRWAVHKQLPIKFRDGEERLPESCLIDESLFDAETRKKMELQAQSIDIALDPYRNS